jgi:hypothetical protein
LPQIITTIIAELICIEMQMELSNEDADEVRIWLTMEFVLEVHELDAVVISSVSEGSVGRNPPRRQRCRIEDL